MLTVYSVRNQQALDKFISNTMSGGGWPGWAFAQPDCGKVSYPAQFVIVPDEQIKLAVIRLYPIRTTKEVNASSGI